MPTPAGSKSAWWPIAIRRVTFSARSQGNDGLCPLGAIHGPPEDQLSYFWIFVDVCNGTFTFALKAVLGGTEAKGGRKRWLVVVNCVADKLTQPR